MEDHPAGQGRENPSRGETLRLLRSIAAFAGAILAVILLFEAPRFIFELEDPATITVIWCSLVVAMISSGSIALRGWWRFATVRTVAGRSFVAGRLLKIACVFGALCLLVVALIFGAQSTLVYRIAVARAAYADYTMEFDPPSQEIRVSGMIGPGISRKLEHTLDTHVEARSIVLTSVGGLVDESLKSASAIARHKDVVAIARGHCDSACIILLMSATKRYADWNIQLGFHAGGPIIPTHAKSTDTAVAGLTNEGNQYLIMRGVPKSIIDDAISLGPETHNYVAAIKLVEIGVLTGLVDRGSVISPNLAKWMVVEDALERAGSERETARLAAGILAAARSAAAAAVDSHAETLYAALQSGDNSAFEQALAALIGDISVEAMASADPAVAFRYLTATTRELEHFSSTEAWEACASQTSLHGVANLSDASPPGQSEKSSALIAMIRSAADVQWAKPPVPGWAGPLGAKAIAVASGKTAATGLDLGAFARDARVKCVWTTALMQELMTLDPARAVEVYRQIADQDPRLGPSRRSGN